MVCNRLTSRGEMPSGSGIYAMNVIGRFGLKAFSPLFTGVLGITAGTIYPRWLDRWRLLDPYRYLLEHFEASIIGHAINRIDATNKWIGVTATAMFGSGIPSIPTG